MTSQTTFPIDALNAEAAKSIDKAGTQLLAKFVRRPVNQRPPEPFASRIPTALTVTLEADAVSQITDFAARPTGWCFTEGGEEVVLVDEGYRALRLLIERVFAAAPFNAGFSFRFVEKVIAHWAIAKIRGETVDALSSHLLGLCKESYGEHTVAVPLACVEIERDFMVGRVTVRTLAPKLFDTTEAASIHEHGEKSDSRDRYREIKKQLANRAAVTVTILGEPEFARERALEVADDMAGVLRFLSPSVFSSILPSHCQPMGREHVPSTIAICLDEVKIHTLTKRFFHYGLVNWKLSHERLDKEMAGYLGNIGMFFNGLPLSDYATRVLGAFRGYTRALGSTDPSDRLVGVVSALELLLLTVSSEHLQQTVGERLAFLTASESKERREIVSIYKKAYSLRSRHVHNLAKVGVKDEEAADAFFLYAYVGFRRAIAGLNVFEKHADFIDGIEEVKFGGSFAVN